MTTQELMPFWRIVEQLRQFCAERLTGTVFIVSDDNRMAQVHLESGNIVMLLCRGRRGLEALTAMRTMLNARLRFDDSYVSATETENLNTSEVIDQLGISLANAPAAAPRVPTHAALRVAPAAAAAAPQAATAAATAAAAAPAMALSADAVGKLEKMLVQYIGPMAQIVCADHVEQAADLRSLALALSTEIPDKKQADAFRAEAGRSLGLGSL